MTGILFLLVLLAGLSACTTQKQAPTPDEIRERTAQATATAKNDAQAFVEGVREGWSHDHPLDLNHATHDQLTGLPGVTGAEADRVIAGRPYSDPHEVVNRRIMSQSEYDKIADRVTAK